MDVQFGTMHIQNVILDQFNVMDYNVSFVLVLIAMLMHLVALLICWEELMESFMMLLLMMDIIVEIGKEKDPLALKYTVHVEGVAPSTAITEFTSPNSAIKLFNDPHSI